MNKSTLRGGVLGRVLGAAIFALASASAAQAAVITFEGQTGPAYNGRSFQEDGYTVAFEVLGGMTDPGSVLVGRFIDGSVPATCAPSICPTNNPTTYFDLFNSGLIDIIAAPTGSTFRFTSLDASFIATPGVAYPAIPAALQIIGLRADQTTETIQFNIPDTIAFQTYDAADADLLRSTIDGATFAMTDFVEIAIIGFRCDENFFCSGLDNGPGEIGVDNIVLSDLPVNPVPEPATLSLLAFGLLGLGARMRRRH
ncbi:NF038120 family PEP-CTERM protein [Massilia aerilata]|uniref:NF038120 family PEP-CTERM protein n=1 Tax=Massilia aerilata TaxID=453817 RepID=A0ABW0S608_9BURK